MAATSARVTVEKLKPDTAEALSERTPLASARSPVTKASLARSAVEAAMHMPSSPTLAAQKYLQREEVCASLAPRLQATTQRGVSRLIQQGHACGTPPTILSSSCTEFAALQQTDSILVHAQDQIGGAGAPARLRGGGGKDEESADRSRGQLAEAYQSPQMQLAAMAAKRFEGGEGVLFAHLESEAEEAREHARLAENKAAEAVLEAQQWARITSHALEEKHEARQALEAANKQLDAMQQLIEEGQSLRREIQYQQERGFCGQQQHGERAQGGAGRRGSPAGLDSVHNEMQGSVGNAGQSPVRRLPLLPPPPAGPSFVELQQRAERLAVEAAELEEESKLPEAAAGRAMKEGERLHAQERAQRAEVARLEDELNYMKQIAEVQQSTAMQDLMEAEAALLTAEQQHVSGAFSINNFRQEVQKYAHQADVMAHRAELALGEAAQAGLHVKQIVERLDQIRMEVDKLHNSTVNLYRTAMLPAMAAESLMQQAYKKATLAFETRQAAKRVQQGGIADPYSSGSPSNQDGRASGLVERLSRIRTELSKSQEKANELVGKAHSHLCASRIAGMEAGKRVTQVERVAKDVSKEKLEEHAALNHTLHLGKMLEHVSEEHMAQQIADLEARSEWQSISEQTQAHSVQRLLQSDK